MTQFKTCPLCQNESYFCERCNICDFSGCFEYYNTQDKYNILFYILHKTFPMNLKYFDLDQTKLLNIYIEYEKKVYHEIMLIDIKFEILVKIITSFLRSRSKISWIKWNYKNDNRKHSDGVLELHMRNIPNIWRGYLPLDCCHIIYSYLHINVNKKFENYLF